LKRVFANQIGERTDVFELRRKAFQHFAAIIAAHQQCANLRIRRNYLRTFTLLTYDELVHTNI